MHMRKKYILYFMICPFYNYLEFFLYSNDSHRRFMLKCCFASFHRYWSVLKKIKPFCCCLDACSMALKSTFQTACYSINVMRSCTVLVD